MATQQGPHLDGCGGYSSTGVVDVVFVHGLGGDHRETWTAKSRGVFWPEDLARELGGRVNVWSLAYDAPLLKRSEGGRLKETLGQDALELLHVLTAAERDRHAIGERPIVFVTHSLGGLVVKSMLRRAEELSRPGSATMDRTVGRIAERTRAVVFIATPHCGASLASLSLLGPTLAHGSLHLLAPLLAWSGFVLGGLALALRRLVQPSQYLQQLAQNDPALRELQVSYRQFAEHRGIETLAYYERRPYLLLTVVSPCSADPGLAACTPVGIDAHHIGIAKLPVPQQATIYKDLRALIERVARQVGAGRTCSVLAPAIEQDLIEVLGDPSFEPLKRQIFPGGQLDLPRRFDQLPADSDLRVRFERALRDSVRGHIERGQLVLSDATVLLAETSAFDLDKYVLYLWREQLLSKELKALRRCVAREADAIRHASGTTTSLIPLYRAARAIEHGIGDDLGAIRQEIQQALAVIKAKQAQGVALDGGGETQGLLTRVDAALGAWRSSVDATCVAADQQP
jgi:pimeloyl-ACP methyl ester carboxylesterase